MTEAHQIVEERRVLLASLARELHAHGLSWRLLGADGSILRVVAPETGRVVMVLATETARGGHMTWTYLWNGGGIADARDPDRAAAQIAAGFRRPPPKN